MNIPAAEKRRIGFLPNFSIVKGATAEPRSNIKPVRKY